MQSPSASSRMETSLGTGNKCALSKEVVSRKVAKGLGLKRYFTGLPCKNGHISERNTSKGTCVECSRLKGRETYSERQEYSSAYGKEHRRINKDKISSYQCQWRLSNREYAVKWRIDNPDYNRLWREDNPEKNSVQSHKRRARIRNAPGQSYTVEQISSLWNAVKHKCACCGCVISLKTRHIDHIVPLSRGGSNEIRNVQFLCAKCNTRKAAKDPIDFMQSRGFLI